MPNMCGSVRRKPKFAPDAVSITLFGPGVMDMTKEYVAYGSGSSMAASNCNATLPSRRASRQTQKSVHLTHCIGYTPIQMHTSGNTTKYAEKRAMKYL